MENNNSEILIDIYNNIKIKLFLKEYNKIKFENKFICQVFDTIIDQNSYANHIYKTEIFLLMSELLPINECPYMREAIRVRFKYVDSDKEREELDSNFLNKADEILLKSILDRENELIQIYSENKSLDNNEVISNLVDEIKYKAENVIIDDIYKNLTDYDNKLKSMKGRKRKKKI